jgi:biopolymer transport protein ExbD
MFARRKKRHLQGEVELNLAAMLDMAFQLLAFFILTFRPAPVEGDVVLRMPAPRPTTSLPNAEPAGASPQNPNPAQGLTSLVITVDHDESGGMKSMAIGDQPIAGWAEFDRRLQAILGDAATGFDQVLIQVGSELHYEELMRVVDVCTRQKLADGRRLSKLSFVPLPSH